MGSKKLILGFIMCIMFWGGTSAQNTKIQSGIIYYFTTNVEWPSSKSSGDFVIGVVGSGGIISSLKELASAKKVGTRKIVIKNVSSASAGKGCHILFLTKNKSSEVEAAVGVANSSNSLLVTESSGLGKKGSGINFVIKAGKTAFEINESAINGCGLKISGKLKSLGIVL